MDVITEMQRLQRLEKDLGELVAVEKNVADSMAAAIATRITEVVADPEWKKEIAMREELLAGLIEAQAVKKEKPDQETLDYWNDMVAFQVNPQIAILEAELAEMKAVK